MQPKGYWFEFSRGSHLRRSAAMSAFVAGRNPMLYRPDSHAFASLSPVNRRDLPSLHAASMSHGPRKRHEVGNGSGVAPHRTHAPPSVHDA